jgi:Caspase domain
MIAFLILVASARPAQAAPAAGCAALAGRWSWFNGFTVTIVAEGSAEGASVLAKCETLDLAQRRYVIRWVNGFVDTLVLSRDGNTLDGTNAHGIRVFGARMGTSSSTSARDAKCEALAGRWNWFIGPPLVIREDGTLDNGFLSGRCDGIDLSQRRYAIRWQNGVIDTVALSADNSRLDGLDNLHIPVSGTRANATAKNDKLVIDTPPALVPIPERASSVAVVIGIGNYREPEIPKLPYAQRDAEIVSKYLQNVAGIRPENLRFISDDRATLSDINDAINNWLTRRASENSTVFIYYAGHGAVDPSTGDTFLVPYEGSPESPSTRLYPLKQLYESLEALKARDVTVFLDSCFSGGGRSISMRGRPIVITSTAPETQLQKVTVLAAAQGNQISSDLDSAQHGLFTYFLLSGIRGEADTSRDGWVDLNELYDFVRQKVQSTAISELNRDQVPALLGPPDVEHRAKNLKLFKMK